MSIFGGLDVLVNNAGTGIGVGEFIELTDHRWDLSWLINVMGPVAPSTGATIEDATRSVVESIPVRRLGTPDDVATAITWLVQPGSYVSGAVVPVTGAMVAGPN
ncbi:hypothetical protein GCM10009610_69270 [Pseudonocardia xinjiangensis]